MTSHRQPAKIDWNPLLGASDLQIPLISTAIFFHSQ
jgi:hypothetical protein